MLKYSRQRECIKKNLQSRCDHPTAEMVYEDLRKTNPNLSLGTVYRNLSLLSDLGEVQKLSTGAGPDRFDGDTSTHYHFLCRSCGSFLDLPMAKQELLDQEAGTDFRGRIEGHQIQFFGICENCLKNQ